MGEELVPVAMYENMASVLQRTDLGQVRASPIALAGCLPCRRARPTVNARAAEDLRNFLKIFVPSRKITAEGLPAAITAALKEDRRRIAAESQ